MAAARPDDSARDPVTDSFPSAAPPLQQVDRTCVFHKGRKLSYFGGCDYFRLASHPAVHQALLDGLRTFGLNVAASRRTTGNHELYESLEQRLAGFFAVEEAVLVSNGYMTNLAVAQALAGHFSHVLIDTRAHASLFDAAGFFDCPIITFPHRDSAALARAAERCGRLARPILLTDGLFSHSGAVAPLTDYLRALPGDGMILVDDAHGAGILGRSGRGTVEHLKLSNERIIQTITLSKAFGVYGGAVLGTRKLAKMIRAKSRVFIGNTPLPLPLAAAALKSLELVQSDGSFRRRLHANTRRVRQQLRLSKEEAAAPGPIIAIAPERKKEMGGLKKRLLAHGIYPSFIDYPGGPAGGYFRFAISSEHTAAQLDSLARGCGCGCGS